MGKGRSVQILRTEKGHDNPNSSSDHSGISARRRFPDDSGGISRDAVDQDRRTASAVDEMGRYLSLALSPGNRSRGDGSALYSTRLELHLWRAAQYEYP